MTVDPAIVRRIAESLVTGPFDELPPEMQDRMLAKAIRVAEDLAEPEEAPQTGALELAAATMRLDHGSEAAVAVSSAMASLGMPSPAEWAALTGIATQLSRSALVPKHLRDRPDDVMLLLLSGRELSIGPVQAINKIHIIEGKPSVSPELMQGLVRRAGFPIWPAPDHEWERADLDNRYACDRCGQGIDAYLHLPNDRTKATVLASRDGRRYEFTFTIDDAMVAGLCQMKDGKPFARSDKGKALPWESYTQFMLWARALSGLCRMVFADVLMGVTYTPDELAPGVELDEHGEIIDAASLYRPAGEERPLDIEAHARSDGWTSVADFVEHDARLKAEVGKLDEPTTQRYWSWALKNGLRENGSYTKDSWVGLHAKAVEKANPGAAVAADPIGGAGPVGEPVVTPGADPEACLRCGHPRERHTRWIDAGGYGEDSGTGCVVCECPEWEWDLGGPVADVPPADPWDERAERAEQASLDGVCPTCHGEGTVERAATPEEVDNGAELGVAYDPCPNEAWHFAHPDPIGEDGPEQPPTARPHNERLAAAQAALARATEVSKQPVKRYEGRELTEAEVEAFAATYPDMATNEKVVTKAEVVGKLTQKALDGALMALGLSINGFVSERRRRLATAQLLADAGLWTDTPPAE